MREHPSGPDQTPNCQFSSARERLLPGVHLKLNIEMLGPSWRNAQNGCSDYSIILILLPCKGCRRSQYNDLQDPSAIPSSCSRDGQGWNFEPDGQVVKFNGLGVHRSY